MISAPRSPNSIEQNGPDNTRVRSTTRMPKSGRAGFMILISHPLHWLEPPCPAAASLVLSLIAHCPIARFPASCAVPATRRGREWPCPRAIVTGLDPVIDPRVASAAEGATGPRKRSGKRTAAGSGISGKPAGSHRPPHRRSKGAGSPAGALNLSGPATEGGHRHRHVAGAMTRLRSGPVIENALPDDPTPRPLKTTPLDAWHRALGARMVRLRRLRDAGAVPGRAGRAPALPRRRRAVRRLAYGPGDADRRRRRGRARATGARRSCSG